MIFSRLTGNSDPRLIELPSVSAEDKTPLLSEKAFQRTLSMERKRTERSLNPFVLMLLEFGANGSDAANHDAYSEIAAVLQSATRETDVKGWYASGSAIGVMFTEIGGADKNQIVSALLERINTVLRACISSERLSRINISVHLFPDNWTEGNIGGPGISTLYPDLLRRNNPRHLSQTVKRIMDVAGSVLGLLLASPILLTIAAAIKITSGGPVLFRQTRIGQYGVPFTFLKFRSMYINNSPAVHKEYVRKLIANQVEAPSTGSNGNGTYKLTGDPRVTRLGKFLRRTSLDELPQLINVLRGEMSLVGPRPALGYEVEAYEVWHRSRLLEAKPGITGLWQVNGRSRVKFDEMVRLDLRYARSWSPWLDIKILLRTPFAVVSGEGAY